VWKFDQSTDQYWKFVSVVKVWPNCHVQQLNVLPAGIGHGESSPWPTSPTYGRCLPGGTIVLGHLTAPCHHHSVRLNLFAEFVSHSTAIAGEVVDADEQQVIIGFNKLELSSFHFSADCSFDNKETK
jgi:hypothetical protein